MQPLQLIYFSSLLLAIILQAGTGCAMAETGVSDISAREIFAQLPTSIFENTPEGMQEPDKQDLLDSGKSEFWEISAETPDVLVFNALPFHDRTITLRLFRNAGDGSVEIAIGTLGEPVCAIELWHLDQSGRMVPVDTPPEPGIEEFFRKRHKLSQRIHSSVLICLDSGGIVAKPLFWNERGMLPAKLDNEINFVWNGTSFQKVINPSSENLKSADAN